MLAGALLLAGWAALVATGAGIDLGDGIPGGGPTGAFLALAVGGPAAAAIAAWAWDRRALRGRLALVAIGGAAGLAAWSALSIAWAAAPDLAWIDANRMAISTCALVAGAGLGALVPRAPRAFGVGLAAAAMVPVALALGSKVFPAVAGGDRDLARLSAPVGYWNALALIAVFALPGLLWLAAGPRAGLRRAGPALAGAGVSLVVCVLLLTYSRGGLLAGLVAVAVAVVLLPGTWRALAAVAAGIAGAILPAAHALTDPALTADRVPVDVRQDAGLGLGWRLVVGVAIAAALAHLLPRIAARAGLDTPRVRRGVALACAALVVVAAVGTVATPQGREAIADRWAEARGDADGAVANDAGRITSAADNQRGDWWAQAWRGWLDSPVVGHGAGGFRLVHLQERTEARDRLITAEPHDTILRTLSGTGLIGFAFLAALVGAVAVALRRALRGPRDPAVALPAAVLAAFAVQSMVDWSWAIPGVAIPAFAAAGVVLAQASPGRAGGARRPGAAATGLLAGAAFVLVLSALMPWWSMRLADAAERALADGRPALAVERAESAHARNPLALSPLRAKAAALSALGEDARALGTYQQITEVQPENPAAWRLLARVYGDDPRARAAWERVRELSPLDRDAAAFLEESPAG